MFNNPGKSLKTLAKVIFVLIITAVLMFIVLASSYFTSQFDNYRIASTVFGIVVAGIGLIVAWLNSIFIYALGSMVEDIKDIKERLYNDEMQKM